jgi:HrpA-like RNA helicase
VNGAVRQLKQLGAIDTVEGTKLSNLGHQMAVFPLDPRFSKILLSAKDYGCLYVQLYIKYIFCILDIKTCIQVYITSIVNAI